MTVEIRPIQPSDATVVAHVIRTVMPEFGAGGAGFAIHDREVDDMYTAYTSPGTAYFVCEAEGKVMGGGGIGPLAGGDTDYCELKKMYFLPEARGLGLGQKVLEACLQAAKAKRYRFCYLETFNTMNKAMKLYEKAASKK
jgi:putative acetyltransferase